MTERWRSYRKRALIWFVLGLLGFGVNAALSEWSGHLSEKVEIVIGGSALLALIAALEAFIPKKTTRDK
jgi:hypothetical protein